MSLILYYRKRGVARDETIKLWNIKTLECVKTFTGNSEGTFSIIETKNNYLISGGYKKLKMWNMKCDNSSSFETVINIQTLDPTPDQTNCSITNLLESRYGDIICQTTNMFYIINIEKKLMIFKYIIPNDCKIVRFQTNSKQIIETEDMKIILCENDKLKFYH